jgi:hypothetical protein
MWANQCDDNHITKVIMDERYALPAKGKKLISKCVSMLTSNVLNKASKRQVLLTD